MKGLCDILPYEMTVPGLLHLRMAASHFLWRFGPSIHFSVGNANVSCSRSKLQKTRKNFFEGYT